MGVSHEAVASRERRVSTPLSKALAGLLCAASLSAQAQDLPAWLVEAKAREARTDRPAEVVSEDRLLRALLPGTVKKKVVLDDGSYSIGVELDAGAAGSIEVSCEVFPGSHDLAAILAKTSESSFVEIQKLNGTVEARALESSDAGAVGPYPYLSLQWIYRASKGGETRVGGLKQFVAATDEAVAYCANDDLGFVKSFDAVSRALTTSLRLGDTPARPYFREVSVVRLDGARVGVASTTMTRDGDGDTQVATRTALLVAPTPDRLISQDVAEVQWVGPEGNLINAAHAKSSNGKLVENLALKRQGQAPWRITGTLDGKSVDLEVQGTPSSQVAQAWARKRLMAQPKPVGAQTESLNWGSPDLSRLLTSRSTVVARTGTDRYAAREELGGLVVDVVLDAQTGTMFSAKMQVGPLMLNFERIYRDGEF